MTIQKYKGRLGILDEKLEDPDLDDAEREACEFLRTLITALDKDGMSSDESEVDEDSLMRSTNVKLLKWRADCSYEFSLVDRLQLEQISLRCK